MLHVLCPHFWRVNFFLFKSETSSIERRLVNNNPVTYAKRNLIAVCFHWCKLYEVFFYAAVEPDVLFQYVLKDHMELYIF